MNNVRLSYSKILISVINYNQIIISFFMFITYDCKKVKTKSYEFDITITFSPGNDTINIGDTLWLESKFSDQLYDRKKITRQLYLLILIH